MIGGYSEDPEICTTSQPYVALVDAVTGQTAWVNKLNKDCLEILAIKFLGGGYREAVVVVLHPASMFLSRVRLDGTAYPSTRMSTWSWNNEVWRDKAMPTAVETDNEGNFYIGTYSD